VIVLLWWRIVDTWDCLWYYSRGKVKTRVFYFGDDTYSAFASNGFISIWNCYGSTPEAAKEMALLQLKLEIEKGEAPLD
jgi:hypothetical protein